MTPTRRLAEEAVKKNWSMLASWSAFGGERVVDAVAEAMDALAKRVEELEHFFDSMNCPVHGKWFDNSPGYVKCGKCHDRVLAVVEAARKAHDGHVLNLGCGVTCDALDAFDKRGK